ncbi:MAG: hypothetical protein JWO86_4113 [Myxococcaceae bacterium]|nr:hypothetical protein [Myxococcaceae bacterium]
MRRSVLALSGVLLVSSCSTSPGPVPVGDPNPSDGSSGAPGPADPSGMTSGSTPPSSMPTSGTVPTTPPGTSFSFVVVGCNRVEKADIDPAEPSTANVEQLTRTFAEVAALKPPPKFFFFAGDMVYGFTNGADLATQLQGWLALYAASPLPAAGVTLVPVQGNHESQAKSGKNKLAYVDAETTWVTVMGPHIQGANGPKAGGADALATDQSKLTYSFDYAGTHFVILNTDPVGKDWQVPAQWAAADLAAAHAAGAKHVFAIGHKPAYPSPLSAEGGLSMFPAVRDAFWTAMETNHAEAMLAAHNHLWFKTRPTKTWQIVAGNGGSLLEPGVTGADAYYGFTHVEVDANGTVTAKSHGRDVPAAGYLASSAANLTTVRDTVDLTWK